MTNNVRLTWDNNAVTATHTRIERQLAPILEENFNGPLNQTIVGPSIEYSRAPAANAVWAYVGANDINLTGNGSAKGKGHVTTDFGTSDYVVEAHWGTPEVLSFESAFQIILDTDANFDSADTTTYNNLNSNGSGRIRYYERGVLIMDFGGNTAPNGTAINFFRVTKTGTSLAVDIYIPSRGVSKRMTAVLSSDYSAYTHGGFYLRGDTLAEAWDYTVLHESHLLIMDDFTQGDGTGLSGRTPNYSLAGGTWGRRTVSPDYYSNIYGNAAANSSTGGATVNTLNLPAVYDILDVSLDFTYYPTAVTQEAGIVVRVVDQNNLYLCRWYSDGYRSMLQIYKRVSGTFTALKSLEIPATSGTLRFQMVGDYFQLSANGFSMALDDCALHKTGLGVGLRLTNNPVPSVGHVDNFIVRGR